MSAFDPEIIAMNKIGKILDKLPDQEARERVAGWVVSKVKSTTQNGVEKDNEND